MSNKVIVVTAPSGAGKSTIGRKILESIPHITFSVSATTRAAREYEVNGLHYRFLSLEKFREAITDGQFLEYEEVYPGVLYGTLRADVEAALESQHVLLDIDVKGARRVKEIFGNQALVLFIKPPSIEELRARLTRRKTESEHTLETRLARARKELEFESCFDRTIVNDDLDLAIAETIRAVKAFIGAPAYDKPSEDNDI